MSSARSLKQRIHEGEIVIAARVPVTISRSQLEDGLSKSDYDFLYIDGQHTAFSEDQLVSFCATAEALDLPVQFRIPHTRHTYLIGRYLDLGPTAIMVPEVTSEAEVNEAINYFYYPQTGRRSWGGSARRGIKNMSDRLTYADWWNNYGFLAIQLESIEAIINAGKLARPGVDILAFGPNDLCFSLEAHPHHPFQDVDTCMRHVAQQIKGSGLRLGMAVTTVPEERDKYLEMGVTVFQESL